MSAFLPRFDQLPADIPIFPLAGAMLLPGGSLPLRIFEPRYLQMVDDALRAERLIGMIQPRTDHSDDQEEQPAVYALGCAGRITSFTETDEGHYSVDLTGVVRFRLVKELPLVNGYRRVTCDFSDFRDDLVEAGARYSPEPAQSVSPELLSTINRYFDAQGIEADMDSIAKADLPNLVTALSMSCPFNTIEKQALLEAENAQARIQVLVSIMEMASVEMSDAKHLN